MKQVPCEYYALCDNETAAHTLHPILGKVPTCFRCAKRHDLERWPLDDDDE